MSLLLPAGVTSLHDLPHNIFNAVRMGLGFLSFDEMPRDERPPKSIWLEPDALADHMKRVDAARQAKYGGKSSTYADEGIDGESEQNPLMKELMV